MVSPQEILKLANNVEEFSNFHLYLKKEYKLEPIQIKATTIKEFVKNYNLALKSNFAMFKKLSEIVPKGVGHGEILLSSLHPKLTINGGSESYDVNFMGDKFEVKGVNINNGVASNFRLGVESKPAILNALSEIRDLYHLVKIYVPEIDTPAWKIKVDKGEMTALRKFLSNFDLTIAEGLEKLNVSIHKNLDVKHNGVTIGSLLDNDIIKKLKILAVSDYKKIKSYNEIEQELAKELANHDMKYLFLDIKTLKLYYKERLSDTFIESITGGIIKVKCRLT
jgi:hypothetical protein